jgi:hypothetical protein
MGAIPWGLTGGSPPGFSVSSLTASLYFSAPSTRFPRLAMACHSIKKTAVLSKQKAVFLSEFVVINCG